MEKLPPWEKTLYGNAGYPDNHTDITFLKDLQRNKNVKIFQLSEAVSGATQLNQQISTCIMFLVLFYVMYAEAVTPELVLNYSLLVTLAGYLVFMCNQQQQWTQMLRNDSKTVLAVLIFGYILSPMLHTLTDSISTDTIFTITFFVMTVHLIFFDYGLPAFMVSKAVSLNAAIFGSICLASRLPTSFHAFTLLVVAAQFFVLLPALVRAVWHPSMCLAVVLGCSYTLWHLSLVGVMSMYLLTCFLVNIVCPGMFVFMQQFKNNIHGPWDEAIIKDSDMSMHRFDELKSSGAG